MPNRKSVNKIDTGATATEPAAVAADNGQNGRPAADGASPAMTALSAALTAHTGRTTAELAEAAKVSQSAAAKILGNLEKKGTVRRIKGGRQGARLLPDRWEPVVPNQADRDEQTLSAAEAPEVPEPEIGGGPASEAVVTEAVPVTEPELQVGSDPTEGGEIGMAPEVPAEPEVGAEPLESAEVDPTAEVEAGAATEPGGEPAQKGGAEKPSGDDSARLRPGALREMVVAYMRDHADEELSPSALGKALDRSSGAIANSLDKLVTDGIVGQTSAKPRRYRYFGPRDRAD